MFLSSEALPAFMRSLFLSIAFILFASIISDAQSIRGVNGAGTFGNEVIEGRIFFPEGNKSELRPTVKLKGDSSSELTVVADSDGTFRFDRLRPDSYTIVVDGGQTYEKAFETVTVGNFGMVSAAGNISDYTAPIVYRVQIYLKSKNANALDTSLTRNIPANVPAPARESFNLAIASARLGQNAKALEQFKAAIAQAPNFGLAYYEMGLLHLKLGQANQAEKAFAEAIKHGCDDALTHQDYGIALLNQKKFAAAEEELRHALQRNARSSNGHYYLGLALLNRREFDAAEMEFKSAIANSNDRLAQAHRYLGGIYWQQKKYAPAAEELEKYLKLDPKAADAAKIRETIRDLRART